MFGRVIATIAAIACYVFMAGIFNPAATLLGSEVAGKQFENSDASYLQTAYTLHMLSLTSWGLTLILLGVIVLIWLRPARELAKKWWASLALVALLILPMARPGYAFFDKTDRTEIIPVLPNWSAFWIPGFGANKDNQVQLDSEAYLQANKVSAKYFQVPHQKLSGSAGFSMFSGYDYYVNSGFLILVDRTPYSREWVSETNRGTSTQNEGFPCQSQEGLNITVGVSVGASVAEADAAKFLYNFGVSKSGELQLTGNIDTDGAAIFQSVRYGRSLVNVMDDVGRKKVQTLICDQIGSRTFDQDNQQMVPIMDTVAKQAIDYFKSVGVTLSFIGWADTFTFDPSVQDAIDRKYIAVQDEDIAKRLQPYATVIEALAVAQATRTFGEKSDGKLPSTYVGLTPEITAILQQLVRQPAGIPK